MDKLVYWEERTINVGDYESVKCGLNYSCSVRDINLKEKTVTISEMTTQSIDQDEQSFKDTVKLMQKRVRSVLNARESDIRMKADNFVTDFSQHGKALMFKTITGEKFLKKHKAIESDAKEAKDLIEDATGDSVFDNE